jgi:hypothetical protein
MAGVPLVILKFLNSMNTQASHLPPVRQGLMRQEARETAFNGRGPGGTLVPAP